MLVGQDLSLLLPDSAATTALGGRLAPILRPKDVVFLSGELGAGKSTLARGLIEAWCGEADAPSPTYTLAQVYNGDRGLLWHGDLYRLRHADEFYELGLIEAAQEGALVLLEWAERAPPNVFPQPLRLRLDWSNSGDSRIARVERDAFWIDRLEHF